MLTLVVPECDAVAMRCGCPLRPREPSRARSAVRVRCLGSLRATAGGGPQVLRVLWDVLAAHHRMRSWLSAQLDVSCQRRAALEQATPDPQPPDAERAPVCRL